MTLPGPVIEERQTAPPRSLPTDVGRWFVTGITEKGPLAPTLIGSLAEKERIYGDRQSYDTLHDPLEAFFREGGSRAYVSRIVGPSPVAATANVLDQSGSTVPGDVALVATAKSVGEWGNALNFEITVSGTDFTVIVSHDTDGVLENSGILADRDAAVAWSEGSDYIALTLGASAEDPRAQGPTSLATGADDRTNIVDAQRQAALDRFTTDLGAGQVSEPGVSTAAAHARLLAHAKARRRFAILDLADTATVATLTTAVATPRASANARYGMAFAPRAVIPGIVPGTTRTVGWSAVQAALEARAAAQGHTAGDAAAGDLGKADRYITGLSQAAWSDADLETLHDAGVNVVRLIDGVPTTYAYRTLVNPLGTQRHWLGAQKARLYMQIAALGSQIAERFQFRTIDGKDHVISEFAGELTGMLSGFWLAGVIFGDTFEEAAVVDVGSQVNTPTTIAAQELHAEIGVRMSEHAERVIIGIANVPVTETV